MANQAPSNVRSILSARRKLAVYDLRFVRFQVASFWASRWVINLLTSNNITKNDLLDVTQLQWNELTVSCRVEQIWDEPDRQYRFIVRPIGFAAWMKLRIIRRIFERSEVGWRPQTFSLKGRISLEFTFI